MRFSIIIATTEDRRLLESIAAQQYNDIEVFFADQNDDDRSTSIKRPGGYQQSSSGKQMISPLAKARTSFRARDSPFCDRK